MWVRDPGKSMAKPRPGFQRDAGLYVLSCFGGPIINFQTAEAIDVKYK